MKIGILTFHYATNYGAVLQAYATQTWLTNRGIEAYIINYVPSIQEAKYHPNEIERRCFIDFRKKPIRNIARWIRYKLLIKKDYIDKTNKFNEFTAKRLKLTSKMTDINELKALNEDFSAFICGSDQIWNPEITNGFDTTYFCGFTDSHIKKVSYAASAGDVEVLSKKENRKMFFELLRNFDGIAVREQSLTDFISKESDMLSLSTLDPTLLLESSDYDKITIQPQNIKSDYLLIYQLARNPKVTKVAKKIAKERNLKIIEVCGTFYNKPHSKHMICSAGPSELLGLIRDASYVVTNSFHGTTFSIIYRKDFNSILSKKRNSRIIDLLNSLELQNRIIREKDDIFNTERIDYSMPLVLLGEKKLQSIDYLKNAIGIDNE